MFGTKKGQGATEYLVLLAVVLIVALVAIALLGFFPGLAGDTRVTQSNTYWTGNAQPIAISQHMQSGTTATLVIQNLASSKVSITALTLGGAGTLVSPTNLSGGATTTVNVTGLTTCTSGAYYEYDPVVITYNTNQLTGVKETGSKPLVGKCS